MALLYSEKKNSKKTPRFKEAEIQSLDYQGLGVAKINGKTWFVENALPGERVEWRVLEDKRQYGCGVAIRWFNQNANRQTPVCPDFIHCGGCQNQHIHITEQRQAKEQALQQKLRRLQSSDIEFAPMITGEPWQYRRRVRLSILFNDKRKTLECGFRQKHSSQIISIRQCAVLEPALNKILPQLSGLLNAWSQPKALGHVELVAADNGVAMLLRTKIFSKTDRTLLLNFADTNQLSLFVQTDEGIEHCAGEQPFYRLNDGTSLTFDVRDFIQINRRLNQAMIDCALDWLDLQPTDRVLDLFCGVGNFTLPLSRHVRAVVGVEGVLPMVLKARANAEQNGCQNVEFYQADLNAPFIDQPWASQPFNKILLDPPRTGAAFALNALCQLKAMQILYVSCNPATLVRDAEILLASGYRLDRVAMIDMFPHTGHLESVSLFRLQE